MSCRFALYAGNPAEGGTLLSNGRVYPPTHTVSGEAGNSTAGTCEVSVAAMLGASAVDSGPADFEGSDCPPSTGSGGRCSRL